jgi:hypothetical protein
VVPLEVMRQHRHELLRSLEQHDVDDTPVVSLVPAHKTLSRQSNCPYNVIKRSSPAPLVGEL